jgi:alpha-tubulin suppressor-like RCC1 family protein
VKSVSCGGSFACFVLGNGTVQMVGATDLAPGLLIGSGPVPLPCTVTHAVAGSLHVIAFAAGTDCVYSWGYNVLLSAGGVTSREKNERTHQCGRASSAEILEPKLLVQFAGKRVIQAACGAAHTLVLTDEGEVFG